MTLPQQNPTLFSKILQRMAMEASSAAKSGVKTATETASFTTTTSSGISEHNRQRKRLNLERTIRQLKLAKGNLANIPKSIPIDPLTPPPSSSPSTSEESNKTEATPAPTVRVEKGNEDGEVDVGGVEDLNLFCARKARSYCEQCSKTFASAFQLKEHISIIHMKEKNFACDLCGAKFGRRGGLRRHVQMVHQNHVYKCVEGNCEHPGFKCSKALAAHIRAVHTKIRPFLCEKCGRDFVRKNDLKTHILTHQEDVTFPCRCGKNFRRQVYLRKHQRNCAGVNPSTIDMLQTLPSSPKQNRG